MSKATEVSTADNIKNNFLLTTVLIAAELDNNTFFPARQDIYEKHSAYRAKTKTCI